MKIIYKSRNLALTALFGVVLSMGTPSALAQDPGTTFSPISIVEGTVTGDYQSDLNQLSQYQDYVNSEADYYKETYPDFYGEIFAPTIDQILSQLEDMIARVESAKAIADRDGSEYVSPLTESFYNFLTDNLQALAEDALWVDVYLAQEQVQTLGSKLIGKVQELKALFDQKIANVVGEEAESFFLGEADSDAILEDLQAMEGKIAQAADEAQNTGSQRFVSPVTPEWISEIDQQILDFYDSCRGMILTAEENIQLYKQDVETLGLVQEQLTKAATEIEEKFINVFGEDLDQEDKALVTDAEDYTAIESRIENLRQELVFASTDAAQNNWQSYVNPTTLKDTVSQLEQEIAQYKKTGLNRIDQARTTIRKHDGDISTTILVENQLASALKKVQTAYANSLRDIIGKPSDAGEEYFYYEEMFYAIQDSIDTMRLAIVRAYNVALENCLESYESPRDRDWSKNMEAKIEEYGEECMLRIDTAVENLHLYDEDANMISELETVLQAALDEVDTEAADNIDADILEGIRDFLVVEGYDKVSGQIKALRASMVNQYDIAASDNWQKYEQQVVPNADAVDQAIAQYKEESGERVLKALASIEAHQYDLDLVLPLNDMLGEGIQELMEQKPELFEEGSAFIEQYEQISAQIENLWLEIVVAAMDAEADNWQWYNSPLDDTDIQALYTEVDIFLAQGWGDTATVNLYRWEADNDAVLELESKLMAAVMSIQSTNPDFDVDPDFDQIQEAIDALRHKMADAYEAADATAWETYQCPYTEEDLQAVEAMIEDMVAHSQGSSAIEAVNEALNEGEQQPMIFSVDGKRLNAPIKGQLNIFIYHNRVEKKIVK